MRNNKEIISFDIDGVSAKTNQKMIRIVSEWLGRPFEISDVNSYDLKKNLIVNWGMSVEMADKALALYSDPVFFKNLSADPEAKKAYLLLRAMHYEVQMNSARPNSCREVTMEWVNRHFIEVLEAGLFVGGTKEKIQNIVNSGAVFHVDDHDETVVEINSYEKTKAKLIKRPWNRTGLVPKKDELHSGWRSFLALAFMHKLGLREQWERALAKNQVG